MRQRRVLVVVMRHAVHGEGTASGHFLIVVNVRITLNIVRKTRKVFQVEMRNKKMSATYREEDQRGTEGTEVREYGQLVG